MRAVILFAVKSFFSLIALVLLTIVIHEGAHLVTALIMRVPITSFIWFDPRYFGPIFVSGTTEFTLAVKTISYSGGLVTGLLLLVILVVKRGWFKQSLYRWLLGLYMATFGFWHLSQGILEGAFHDMYIADATNIFSLSNCVGYTFGVLGLALYLAFMPGIKGLIAKEKYC